jgi:NAD(P)-dependent dehydrogenase (short-subunit alcohol dehydrogenase family)/putative sterol carrier protein
MAEPSKPVLITGCSTGIGRATAERLAKKGMTVYATARKQESIADLEQAGCRTLALDVTDEQSMRAAVAAVEEADGAVGALVNNAGYSQNGAVESLDLDEVRRQFETNVFGLMRMCQLVLPGMRREGHGRIVNLSSMGGKFVFPGGGAYHATKYAVEAVSDALRFEVAGFGVAVAIIEPGLIRTEFAETSVGSIGSGSDFGGPQGRLRGPNGAAGRRPALRGPRDRQGDHLEASPHSLPRHAVGTHPARSAKARAGPGLGPDSEHILPTARRLTECPRHQPRARGAQLAYFKDADEVYAYIGKLFQDLTVDEELAPKFRKANTVVQYQYRKPDSTITVKLVEGEEGQVDLGETTMEPEVVMSMEADTAHRFWLGQVNVTVALARGQMKAKGPVAKILKLVPLTKPVFPRYRQMLEDSGREDLLEA